MKKHWLTYVFLVLSFSYVPFIVNAQIGIGNTSPDPSSILDIQSTTQGLLTPRMTTAQRTAISSPAEGLMVFDTDLNAFYYFNGSVWTRMNADTTTRDNYKLIKSGDNLATVLAAELAAGSGSSYQLDANTLYEINGTVAFDFPINLNNAYIIGRDTNNDIITRTGGGSVFEGSTGGSLRTLSVYASGGSSVFNLNLGTNERLIAQSMVMAGLGSGTVGTISGTAGGNNLVFFSIIQYSLFTNGITFQNLDTLLLNNLGWLPDNTGTMETLSGDFNIFSQLGGFMNVASGSTGIDVSANPVINDIGTLRNITFAGAGTYVNGYTSNSFPGFNFTNQWEVNCTGIPRESDNNAIADLNQNADIGSGDQTFFSSNGVASRTKLAGATTSNNLFRFSSPVDNRLVYNGAKSRFFNLAATISFQSSANNTIYIFYFAKGNSGDPTATVVEQTRVYRGSGSSGDVGAAGIVGKVFLNPGDYVEVWGERFSGGGNVLLVSLNVVVN
ncbi:hypothetical protein [Ascidiimonas aurantiaca]|uniref:hypothetical protein n=1 Tax=Ascidiimonas aurantiaca TaxID=1685432 RepID=UPI0030EDA098